MTLIPPTWKTSTSLLVMSFLALCFQGTRKMPRAGSIQRSPGYLPLLMAFSSHCPNRSFWASLRGPERHRGSRGHPQRVTRGSGRPYPSLSGAAMVPAPQSPVPCRAGRGLGRGRRSRPARSFILLSRFPGNHVSLPKVKVSPLPGVAGDAPAPGMPLRSPSTASPDYQ